MEINIDAFAQEKINLPAGRLNTGVTAQQYHGFHCGVGRIIESPALPDKQSYAGKPETSPDGVLRTAASRLPRPDGSMWNSRLNCVYPHRRLRFSPALALLPRCRTDPWGRSRITA